MQCHRIEELLELLQQEWLTDQDLSLMAFLGKVASEAGFSGPLSDIGDEALIYQLKMRSKPADEMIPGLAKDAVDDFKTALLRARGIIKD